MTLHLNMLINEIEDVNKLTINYLVLHCSARLLFCAVCSQLPLPVTCFDVNYRAMYCSATQL